MANRRMFSLDVIDTDKFMDMPLSAQALYFHLGLRADDDGFVASPKKIMKIVDCKQDDMKVLIAKGYVIPFESGLIVIRHWKMHNYIQTDRYRKTKHVVERERLELVNNVYKLDTESVQDVLGTEAQYSLAKDRIRDRVNIELNNTISSEPEAAPSPQSGICIPLNDKSVYDVPLDKIDIWKTTYPAVDVEQELRKMVAWSHSNPTKRKTRRGVDRFINSWLAREQDRGGSRTTKQQEPTQTDEEFYAPYREMYKNLKPSPDDPFQEGGSRWRKNRVAPVQQN